jgi:hypothetical protein
MGTLFIAHRINTSDALNSIPSNFGVELDLRDRDDTIIISHDPFSSGESFENYLNAYNHQLLVLNIKSERLEVKVVELLNKKNIRNYFFLDSTIPVMAFLSKICDKKIAARHSIYEPIEMSRALKNICRWVWVDCINGIQISKDDFHELKNLGYKICIVSPDLYDTNACVSSFGKIFKANGMIPDAVCAKVENFSIWNQHINLC